MKDYYGKTYRNKGYLSVRSSLRRRLCSYGFDARNLLGAVKKRPLVLPAFLMIVCSFSCYYSSSFIPSVVLACVVIGFCVLGMKHISINKPVFLSVTLMFCSVLVYIGLYIGSRLNASIDSRDRYICTVTSASYNISGEMDLTVKLEGGVLAHANFYCDHEAFYPGDSLVIYGNFKKPSSAGNPGEFDYGKYLRKKGILYVISCERYEIVEKAGFPFSITGSVRIFFYELRRQSFDTVTSFFDDADKSLAAAVCLGDKSLISSGVKRDFKMSCCSHLLAVSGTHFAGFMACIPMVLNVFKVKRKNAFIVQVLFCLLIGCLTGWSDSVTRAAIMSICLFADREWLSALSLASVIMISADPFCPLSSGFQMSFCAVIAIKVYSGKISDFLIKLHLGEKTATVISVPVAAVLGMIPFWSDISMRPDVEHLFIQIAGSFIAGAACTFFIPCVLLCYLLPFWSRYLSMPLKLCLELLLRIVNIGSSLSEMGGSPVHLNSYLLLILGITVFLFMLPSCALRRLLLKPVAIAMAIAVGFNAFSLISKPSCRVVFADVGQGDCCLIITPDKTCLIDAGTYDEGSTTVSDLLDYYGIYRVDICVMSHWDVDHAGGIAALCDQGRTSTILTSYVPLPDAYDKDVQEFLLSTALSGSDNSCFLSQLQGIYEGDRVYLSGSVYFDVLYPSSNLGGGNENSLVLKLQVMGSEETSILFTGDIGMSSEAEILEAGIDPDCDILKVAHHGSKYSSSMEFIEACSPDAAVISVGAHNFYGHPAPATLDRLNSYGCEVFRTDEEGAVVMEF